MRTTRTSFALAIGASMLLAACSGSTGDAPAAGSGGSGSGGSVELAWWTVTQDEAAATALEQTITDFEAANPGITVALEQRSVDAHKDALRTSAGSEIAPDIFYMWAGPGLGGEFVESGVSLDLAKYYQQYGWDKRFSPSTLTNYTQYGGYQGVPWTQRTEVFYYLKDKFAAAGITTPPKTWAELDEAAQKLKDSGVDPITFGGSVNWHVMRFLDSAIEANCGAEKGDALNTREASWANEPCVTDSFTELKKWGDNYFAEGYIGLSQDEAAAQFYSGTVAMALEGDWFTQNIITNGGDINNVGVFEIPTGTGRLYGFAEGQYVGSKSQHPDEAAKFLDYLTSTEVQNKISGIFAAVPVNTEVKAEGEQTGAAAGIAELAAANTKGYYLNNDQNFPLDVTTEYWRVQNAVLTGDIAPADAGSTLQTFIDSHK
jgi:raffinose/stachyose/melibiose transport system substrate-binding protein